MGLSFTSWLYISLLATVPCPVVGFLSISLFSNKHFTCIYTYLICVSHFIVSSPLCWVHKYDMFVRFLVAGSSSSRRINHNYTCSTIGLSEFVMLLIYAHITSLCTCKCYWLAEDLYRLLIWEVCLVDIESVLFHRCHFYVYITVHSLRVCLITCVDCYIDCYVGMQLQ